MNQFLALLSHDEKQLVIHPIDAPQRRAWANPELYLFHNGIRLENVDEVVGTAVHSVIQTTFSPEGCQKALSAMKTNEFLGELVRMPLGCSICDPIISSSLEALQRPSHLGGYFTGIISVLACIWKTQIVVAPTFIGAEPNVIDRGTQQGTQILQSEQDLGLRFMQSLSKELQSKAQIFKTTQPPEVPEDRWNPQTSGIFAGLVRIIIVEQFVVYLPAQARKNRLAQIERHIKDTQFCWIGAFTNVDPFYDKIQSPIIIVEFDHHSGVFLNSTEPARFHIHTIYATPTVETMGTRC